MSLAPDSKLRTLPDEPVKLEARDVAELARQGNPVAQAVFQKAGKALGQALGSLVNTLDLRLYVIGGGLSGAWDLFAPSMFDELERRSYVYRIAASCANNAQDSRSIAVEPAHLGSAAGLVGAAALPMVARTPTTVHYALESPTGEAALC